MYIEKKSRSIVKTISWRVWATLTTMALVYAFTGKLGMAASIGLIEVSLKMLLYYYHERAWNKIKYGKIEVKPKVIWFTGLSGAGKSTLSEALFEKMKEKGYKVEHLDGDAVREIFPKTGFDRDSRDRHVRRVGFLASKLESNGIFVIASFISPYRESREFVRNLCNNFIEVHVATPIEVCEQRDVKGLYKKAREGEIDNFTGVNDPYEEPLHPEITIDTSNKKAEESISELIKKLGI